MRIFPGALERLASLFVLLCLAGAAHADKTPFWLALRSNPTIDKQLVEQIGPRAGIVVLRAPSEGAQHYTFPDIVARIKAGAPGVPVLSYAWITRSHDGGRIESYLLRGLDLGAPLAESRQEKGEKGAIRFVDVTDSRVRRTVIERLTAERKRLGVDGFAVDVSMRTPQYQPRPVANVCAQKPGFCDLYARSMDDVFATLNASLGEPGTLLYNGLWNFQPGMLEDQARLMQAADGAAIEFFGMDPGEGARQANIGAQKKAQAAPAAAPRGPALTREEKLARRQAKAEREARKAAKAERLARQGAHSFGHDILPYLQLLPRLPAGKPVLVFGRGTWQYTDYAADYQWQRYLYASFLLARRKEDMFKYHSSFQVPAHAGRSSGLDVYADWSVDLGDARGPFSTQGGLYQREFANGRVFVAADDGAGGSAQIPGTMYTPEGKALSGSVALAPGRALILLSSAPRIAATRRITGKQIASWGWSQASLSGEQAHLQALPANEEGEHDVLLDFERSPAPFQELHIVAGPLAGDAGVLAVAEVDDPSQHQYWAIVAVGGGAQQAAPAAVYFRSPGWERETWQQVQVAAGGAKEIVLDGPALLEKTGLHFRRWSHLRLVGNVDVSEISLARRASVIQ